MNRRGFLGSILAACAAPAIVRADSLMRILPPETLIYRRPIPFGTIPAGLSIDEFSERYLRPAMATLAGKIERDLLFPPASIIATQLEGALAPKRLWLRAA